MSEYKSKSSNYVDDGSDYFGYGRSKKSLEAELIGLSIAILIPVGITLTLYWAFKTFC